MNKSSYHRALIPLFLASVFLLSLCKIEDTDAWLHLSMGRLIWNLKGLPAKEPFLYTMANEPFSYSSWLFGLIYYMAYNAFDVYGVVLLKAITVTAAFYILVRDSLMPYKNYTVAIIIITGVVIITHYRFVERPDTFLMVFLSFSIYSLNAFVYDNKKYIYALPLVHILWANCHSSINLMVIPFLSFIIGGFIQQYVKKKGISFSNTPSANQLRIILMMFAISFAASLISPYSIHQYTFGLQFLSTEWKQEISELKPPSWEIPAFFSATVVVLFILNLVSVYRSKHIDKSYPSLVHLFIVIPFIFLSFTSQRFVFLLAIVSAPIIIRNISALAKQCLGDHTSPIITVTTAAWIMLYTVLTLMVVGPFGDEKKILGFGINDAYTPENALKYMDKRNIIGKVFNTFHLGQYITWRDFPKRAPFIDGRGYISADLFKKRESALYNALILEELYNKYGFESILITYPIINFQLPDTEYDVALFSRQWALVYWDDVSLVYLKRGSRYAAVIEKDEYKFIKPANGIRMSKLHNKEYRFNLTKELQRNIKETGSSKARAFLTLINKEMEKEGKKYFKRGLDAYLDKRYDEAVEEFKKAIEASPTNPISYSNLGYVYFDLGILEKAFEYQEKAIEIDPNFANAHYGLALIYKKRGDLDNARKHWEEYLKIEPSGDYSKRAKEELGAIAI